MAVFPPLLTPDGESLILDPSRLLLGFALTDSTDGPPRRKASRAEIESALARLRLTLEGDPWNPDSGPGQPQINHTQWALWVRDAQGGAIDDGRLGAIRQALAGLGEWIGPVYAHTTPGGQTERRGLLPHVLLIALHDHLKDQERDGALASLAALGLRERQELSRHLASRYFVLDDPLLRTVFDLLPQLAGSLQSVFRHVRFEQMPFRSPYLYEPRDEHYGLQWNMPLIRAPQAWDLTLGDPSVVIAVIDSGCDLGHPDLSFAGPGMNLRDPSLDGSPTLFGGTVLSGHGTHVAGIAAAIIDNTPTAVGVAGVAGRCRLLPFALDGGTDAQVARGVRAAADAPGVRVISISIATVLSAELRDAIAYAHGRGRVICAAAGNGDARGLVHPAVHPLVMACGGSDRRDERWSVVLPSGEILGSHYGHQMIDGVWKGVSVVAPAWDEFPDNGMPTTDIRGEEGSVRLPSPAGDYWRIGGFSQTSCATPHVSGVAALLVSLHPTLPADDVRRIIERTADKVGSVPYDVFDGFPNGTRNEEMGYGRLNAYHAVDFADVMIRDWSGDEGLEPSEAPGGYFWVAPDIVVRPDDDGMFAPDDVDLSSNVVAGRTNYIYVRVVNTGPQPARGVRVRVTATVPAMAFRYPRDWDADDDRHIPATAVRADLGMMVAGADDRAVFTLSPEQADRLAEWSARGQHPCLLAEVTAENDHAFRGEDTADRLITRRNNLAQRNLRVVGMATEELTYDYAFDAGHEDDEAPEIVIRIDAGALPRDGRVELCVSDLVLTPDRRPPDSKPADCEPGRITLLDPVRVETDWCGCRAVVTLQPGSEIALGGARTPRIRQLSGAEVVRPGCVTLTKPTAVVVLARPTGTRQPMTLSCTYPRGRRRRYPVHVSRLDASGRATGGVTLILGRQFIDDL
jgi:hypothetical protein